MVDCNCYMATSQGDAAPRMWECPEHKVGCFYGIEIVCEKYSKKMEIPLLDAKRIAHGYLLKLSAEHRKQDKIYYDEDYFYDDLKEYFELI